MSAVGFKSGLAAFTDAGTLRSNCCASAPDTLSEPNCRLVPLTIVPVTGPNRIPYLLSGQVDVLVASLGITPERAERVAALLAVTDQGIIESQTLRILRDRFDQLAAYEEVTGAKLTTRQCLQDDRNSSDQAAPKKRADQ